MKIPEVIELLKIDPESTLESLGEKERKGIHDGVADGFGVLDLEVDK